MQKSVKIFRPCKICGASASFVNFGIISCSSCKMFFKRNAHLGQEHFTCEFDGHCEINIYSRRVCTYCRLVKCFTNGMEIQRIQSSRRKKTQDTTKNNQLCQLPTLNLLRSDQSTLSTTQWVLLSNLIHCYDEHGGLVMANRFKFEQNTLPIKLRYKLGSVGEFITSNMSRVQRIFEKNFDYLSLCSNDRSILLRKTVKHTGCIGATFVLHQAQLLDDLFFYKTGEVIFGSHVMSTIQSITDSFDSDVIFIKLVLTIIAFSTTCYTIYTKTPSVNLINLKTIIQIQDTYTELTWRYLTYKYNYEQAVKRFCNLLRCLFHVNFTIVEVDRIQNYTQMIETVVEQTTDLLINNKK